VKKLKSLIFKTVILLSIVATVSCSGKKVRTVGVLDYNTDPKEIHDLGPSATKILMAKYIGTNDYMYYLSGDLWIKSNKKFHVGDTLNFFAVQEVYQVRVEADTTKPSKKK
jgi:hypothetical protein